MRKFIAVPVMLLAEHQYDVYLMSTCHRVCLIGDKFLVEPIIALIIELTGDTLALSVQVLHTEAHPTLQPPVLLFFQS